MNGDFFNENGGIDHVGLIASSNSITTTTATGVSGSTTTVVTAAELTSDYRQLKTGARTTETTLYYDLTNKENFQNGYFDDEPMDVDMSMNAPATPVVNHHGHHGFSRSSAAGVTTPAGGMNRPSSSSSSEVLQISPTSNANTRCIDPTSSPTSLDGKHSAININNNKPSGPKIVKPIRPVGGGGVVKPVIKPSSVTSRLSDESVGDTQDPFKPRPKLYSATSSASSISANEAFDETEQQHNHHNHQLPPVHHQNHTSHLNNGINNHHILNPFQFKSNTDMSSSMPTDGGDGSSNNNNKVPSPRSANSSQHNLGANNSSSSNNVSNANNEELIDEWETHKKRSSKSKSSVNNSPQRSQSTRLSGEHNYHFGGGEREATAAAATNGGGKFESMGHVNTGRRSFGNNNNSTSNSSSRDHIVTEDQDGGFGFKSSAKSDDFFQDTPPAIIITSTTVDNVKLDEQQDSAAHVVEEQSQQDKESLLFNSIFTNENDFQTFLDLLEKKEVDESKENLQRYSEFARQSLYVQFDPILQKSSLSADKLKRLSLIRDKKEAIKNYLSEINEEDETTSGGGGGIGTAQNESRRQVADNNNQVLVAVDDHHHHNHQIPVEKKRPEMTTNDELPVGGSGSGGANRFTLSDDLDDGQLESHDIDHVISDIKSSSYAAEVKHQQRLSMNESEKAITPDRVSLGKTNGGGGGSLHNGIERSPSNENNTKLVDEFESSLKLDNSSIMTTSSYSNKTNNLINRSQYWLEKSNFGKSGDNEQQVAAGAMQQTSQSLQQQPPVVVNGASSSKPADPTPSLPLPMSTAPTPSAENYNELVDELNRLKQNEENYQNTIYELKCNQQEFFQIVVDFEEALKTAEQDKADIEEKMNKEINELTRERDNLQMDVIGLENANKDFQRRIDIVRDRIEEFKENEKTLFEALQLSKQQTEKEKVKYAQLRKQAEEKLNSANMEIEKIRNSTSNEIQMLKAELRKAEIKISSMEKSLQQKDSENTELTNLLDELLAKVKPHS